MTSEQPQPEDPSKEESFPNMAIMIWHNARLWIQRNGELSLFLGILLGLLAATAFKLVLTVAILLFLGAGMLWFLSENKSERAIAVRKPKQDTTKDSAAENIATPSGSKETQVAPKSAEQIIAQLGKED